MYLAVRAAGRRNTRAICTSSCPAERMPSSTFVYTMGTAIRKLTSTDSCAALRSHSSARMVKLATGMLLTVTISGRSAMRTTGTAAAATASTAPAASAPKKPARILAPVAATVCQNAAVTARPHSVLSAASGETRMSGLATATLAACQTSSQNTTASAPCTFLFWSALRTVVEIIRRDGAAHGGRVLLKQDVQIAGDLGLHVLARDAHDVALRDGLDGDRLLRNDAVLDDELRGILDVRVDVLHAAVVL